MEKNQKAKKHEKNDVPFAMIDKITSDVMFEAYGFDEKELLVNAAKALVSILCAVDQIKPTIKKEITLSAQSFEELIQTWLQTIIARVDIDELFFCQFEIKEFIRSKKEIKMSAVLLGEKASAKKGRTVVKAVTYYGFELKEDLTKNAKHRWMCRVSLDI